VKKENLAGKDAPATKSAAPAFAPHGGMALAKRGRLVKFEDRQNCDRCSHEMHLVADIRPMGREPGLMVFRCDRCGNDHVRLVYPERPKLNEAPPK
jgi:hypothetical protein